MYVFIVLGLPCTNKLDYSISCVYGRMLLLLYGLFTPRNGALTHFVNHDGETVYHLAAKSENFR